MTVHMNFWTVDKDMNFDMFISYLYGFLSSKGWLISYFNSYVISTVINSQWPALQLARVAYRIELYGQGSIPTQAWIFFFFFFFFFIFNHLGFSFNCEDHVHFHNMTFNLSIDLTFDQFQLIPSSPQLSVAILSCLKFNIAWVRGGGNLSYYYLLESQDFWHPL